MGMWCRTRPCCLTVTETYINNMMDFILEYWVELLLAALAFAKVVVNLTPTENDNMIFGYLDLIITTITGDRRKPPVE